MPKSKVDYNDPVARAWVQGFAIASALIMRTHHHTCVARDVVRCGADHGPGGMRKELALYGVDESDLLALDPAFTGVSKHVEREWFGTRRAGGGR